MNRIDQLTDTVRDLNRAMVKVLEYAKPAATAHAQQQDRLDALTCRLTTGHWLQINPERMRELSTWVAERWEKLDESLKETP